MAVGEKGAVQRYLSFIHELNASEQSYVKTLTYTTNEEGVSSNQLVVHTWKNGDLFHIKTTEFEQYVDTLHQVDVIFSEKKIVISEVQKLSTETYLSQKKQMEALTYEGLLEAATISFNKNKLVIRYKPEFRQLYQIDQIAITLDENLVKEISITRKINHQTNIETTAYLTVELNSSEEPFLGTALEQCVQEKEIIGKYKNYELVNLTGKPIN